MTITFTKYLVVDGEINDGDAMIYDGFNGISTRHNKEGREVLQKNGIVLKKVELFLCSRLVKAGDICRSDGKPYEEFQLDRIQMGSGDNYYPKELLAWEIKDTVNYWRPLSTVFKVVGKASHLAKWIREGSEFNEDQWQHKFAEPYLLKPEQCIIEFKCPICDTFH